MVGERVRNALDREPVWRQLEGMVSDPSHRIRNKPGEALRRRVPQFPNRNFGGGVAVGVVEAAVAIVLQRTVGIPFGSDTEISDVTRIDGGTVYVVNVDAPGENMARMRAFFESNVGFASLLTDLLTVRQVSVLKKRALRDTYQIEILVED